MAMSNILLFIVVLMLVNMGSTQEWIGSRVVDGRCFLYVEGWTEWDQALAECGNMGGTLATIISRDQLNKIVSALAINPGDFVWIGANDKVTEGTFVWTETNQQAPDIPRDLWELHYPEDNDGTIDCVYFRRGVIVIDNCENPSSYLCMEPNSTTTKCSVSIPSSETTSTSATTIPTTTTLPKTIPTTITDATTAGATTHVSGSSTDATTTGATITSVTGSSTDATSTGATTTQATTTQFTTAAATADTTTATSSATTAVTTSTIKASTTDGSATTIQSTVVLVCLLPTLLLCYLLF